MALALAPEYTEYGYHACIVIAFAIIGFGLKYIDDAFDEETFSKRIAILMAPILVILWISLSIFDSFSATVLFAILFAVLLSGKVDNLTFKLSTIALIAVLFLTLMSRFSYGPLIVLTVMGVADEKGNDYVDAHKTYDVGEFFFAHRCSMKVCTLGLCLASALPWLYLIAFLAFDTAYEFVKIVRYLEELTFSLKIKKVQLAMIVLKKFK
jgi:hypothetical protein